MESVREFSGLMTLWETLSAMVNLSHMLDWINLDRIEPYQLICRGYLKFGLDKKLEISYSLLNFIFQFDKKLEISYCLFLPDYKSILIDDELNKIYIVPTDKYVDENCHYQLQCFQCAHSI